jgi:hypothetical protein
MESTTFWRAWSFIGKMKFPYNIEISSVMFCLYLHLCVFTNLWTLTKTGDVDFRIYYPLYVITISWSLYSVCEDYGEYINTRRTDRNKMLSSYRTQNKGVTRCADHVITMFLTAEQYMFFFLSVKLIACFLKHRAADTFLPVSFTVSAWERVYATNLLRLQREHS